MAATVETMCVRLTPGTLGTIKKFAHDNDMSIRTVLDDLAELVRNGYIKAEKGHITVGSAYDEFEKAAKANGKDPIVVITSVTEQLRRK
jgi:DNA-binding transcriptional MocR family regulator